jgi:TRAP-type C4-dicarboxylate transport system permease large subunit
MIFLIILGSTTFSQLLALSGASSGLINWVTTLHVSSYLILAAMVVIILFLGMLMESVSIMMLTVPIFFPLAQSLGFDLIWFGTLMLISLEVGLGTPPFGLGLFVLLGVAPRGTTLVDVSKAVLPYVMCTAALIIALMFFPGLTRLLG